METLKGERFSDILVAQAMEQGADILATACPYCILNFKDSVATAELEGNLEIKDISEIVAMAMGIQSGKREAGSSKVKGGS